MNYRIMFSKGIVMGMEVKRVLLTCHLQRFFNVMHQKTVN